MILMHTVCAVLLYALIGVLFLGQYVRRYPNDPVNLGLVVVGWPVYVVVAVVLPFVNWLSRSRLLQQYAAKARRRA